MFIAPSKNGGAIHGDKVLVRYRRGQKGLEGEIHRVVERRYPGVVGILEAESRGGLWVIPDNPRFGERIHVSREELRGAKPGQKVLVKITKTLPHRPPNGQVMEVFGNPNDPGVAIQAIIKGSGLSQEFPKNLMALIPKEPPPIKDFELAGREDLRDMDVVTIDGEDAKDFDDAVSLESRGKVVRIGVHIADVSHYIIPREYLDQEAYQRAPSVYLVDRVIPMLPEVFSNGICSLQANQDRLTLSAFMDVDQEGQVTWYKLAPSVIRVRRRLTYNLVQKMLNGEEPLYPALKGMEDAAKILHQRRLRDGSLDFDLPESKVILGEGGKVEKIIQVPRLMSHRIVEEFMLLANETVAKHLTHLDVPGMYRIHDSPSNDDLNEFRIIAHNMGIAMPKDKKVTTRMLQDLLSHAKGKPAEYLINPLMLRAMKLAVYSPMNKGHFGLGKTHYLHFTSPIRRYPDLIVHRVLRESWKPQPEQRWEAMKASMAEWATHCSERERMAEEVEEQTVKLKKLEFMAHRIGQEFDGVVSGIQAFGVFVELKEYLVDGLIHVTNMPGSGYVFDEQRQTLSSQYPGKGAGHQSKGKHQFRLGDPIRVKLVRVSPAQQQLDLALA